MKRVVQLNRLKYTKACHRDKPFLILHPMKQTENNFIIKITSIAKI